MSQIELVTNMVNQIETKGGSSHVVVPDKHGSTAANEGLQ